MEVLLKGCRSVGHLVRHMRKEVVMQQSTGVCLSGLYRGGKACLQAGVV